jgi:hypothetical protein
VVDESKPDQQIPDDATVAQPHTPGVEAAPEKPADDATVSAPRPAAAETPHRDHTAAADRQEAFTARPTVSVPSAAPQSALRSRSVAIALGVVTGLVLFGLTALWLLRGR